jgi:hypothetical protein
MIDLDAVVRAYLHGTPARTTNAGAPGFAGVLLVSLVEDRIYAGVDLPTGYNPDPDAVRDDEAEDRGSALLFNVRSGPASRAPLLYPAIQIRTYGKDEATARAIDRAVFDHLHGCQTRDLKSVWLAVIGQLGRDAAPRSWPYVLSTYRAITRA